MVVVSTAVVAVTLMLSTVGCAPLVKRDLSHIPAGQVGFDDLCDLQSYFDGLASKKLAPPALVSSSELQKTDLNRDAAHDPALDLGGDRTRKSGRSRFAFQTDFQLLAVRRLLNQNWARLPEDVASAPRIDLEVWWSEKSGLRRVLSSENATLSVGGRSYALPYHVCLSELLFGEALYRQRREMLAPGAPESAQPSPRAEHVGDAGPKDASSLNADGASN